MKIAIVGKMCSGKTTLSNSLISKFSEHNIFFSKISFSQKVYEIARDLFNMKEKDRKLLQAIGTKMREINPDVWVDSTLTNINENIIIDDVRFSNEITKLRKNNFILIKLNISNELQLERLKKTYEYSWHTHDISHISENELDSFDTDIFDMIINVDDFNSSEMITNHIFPFFKNHISNLIQQ